MKLPFEKRIILTVLALFCCIALLIGGLIIPSIRYIDATDNATYNLRSYLERRHERSVGFRSALDRYDKVKAEAPTFDSHIFHAGHELELITTLENIAAQNKVKQKVNSSNLDAPSNQRITVSILISGSYADVLHYITDIERLDIFLSIDNMQMYHGLDVDTRIDTTYLNLDMSLYVAP